MKHLLGVFLIGFSIVTFCIFVFVCHVFVLVSNLNCIGTMQKLLYRLGQVIYLYESGLFSGLQVPR